ncbi:MAG: hypothetical protein R3B72_05875 [Polyangiaceae bacterium]
MMQLALVAAVLERPLDPGLTEDEIRSAAEHVGAGPGAVREAWFDFAKGRPTDDHGRLIADQGDWSGTGMPMLSGIYRYPDWFSVRVTEQIVDALRVLARERGSKTSVTLPEIRAVLDNGSNPPSRETLELHVAVMVSLRRLRSGPHGYLSPPHPLPFHAQPQRDDPHPDEATLAKLRDFVRGAFAKRGGNASPSASASERFALYLEKQGWSAMARWWELSLVELNRLDPAQQPTSVCLLCGAMLEAALVAIANAARAKGEWNQKFLKDEPPEKWKLGKLIGQASAAGTFNANQTAHATTLQDHRNRIHVGKYAQPNQAPNPPYLEAHEAKRARIDLDDLVAAILDWKPVAEDA